MRIDSRDLAVDPLRRGLPLLQGLLDPGPDDGSRGLERDCLLNLLVSRDVHTGYIKELTPCASSSEALTAYHSICKTFPNRSLALRYRLPAWSLRRFLIDMSLAAMISQSRRSYSPDKPEDRGLEGYLLVGFVRSLALGLTRAAEA